LNRGEQTEVHFWSGNEACAAGALAAGCSFFAGYPISPSSEIPELLSRRLPALGGIFLQMEDELASIGAVMGASWAGRKAMTATSGPGFTLMQETLGWAFMTETPCVVVDVQRVGPGTGQATKSAQGDVMEARWGSHGDYAAIALSPNSAQEMYELTVRAFNLSEKYRTPVILLADETIAHLRERVNVPLPARIMTVNRRRPHDDESEFFGSPSGAPMPSVGEGFNVAVTASTHDEEGVRFTQDPGVHRRMVQALHDKIYCNLTDIIEAEQLNVDGCDVGIVSFGCVSRAASEAVELGEERGIRIGHVRLKTIWPFPDRVVGRLSENARRIIVPEMNLGQVICEVQRVARHCEVVGLNKIGGGAQITPEEILQAAMGGM
jgi:2-oxoglutarate ferredoxin oxidoreductase subunit alpha